MPNTIVAASFLAHGSHLQTGWVGKQNYKCKDLHQFRDQEAEPQNYSSGLQVRGDPIYRQIINICLFKALSYYV